MPDLLRPEPPRSLRERLAAMRAVLQPARVMAGVGLALLLVAAGWWLLRPPPSPVEDQLPHPVVPAPLAVPATTPVSVSAAAGSPSSPTSEPAPLVVQVAGAVVRPGVYRLRPGARVTDLVSAAGGPAADADLEAMSLAARLVDGQRIQVPHHGEVLPDEVTGRAPPLAAPATPAGPESSLPIEPMDLNSATAEQLDDLPGVGPATARNIVRYRDQHGPFQSVDDLTDVPGIGPAKLDSLRDLVRV